MNRDALFPAILLQERKERHFGVRLSNPQISAVLPPLFPVFRTLDGELFPCVSISFQGLFFIYLFFFKIALSSAYIPYTAKVESQTVSSEFPCNLGVACIASFLNVHL